MRKFTLLAFAALTLFTSCNNDDNNSGQPQPLNNLFPLANGNEWEYKTEAWFVENGDTLNHNSSETWSINKDTLFNGAVAYVITKDYSYGNPATFNSRNDYYKNTPTGFYGLATNQGGSTQIFLRTPIKKTAEKLFQTEFSNLRTFQNGLYVASPPLHLLKYPISMNSAWDTHEFGTDIGVTREFLGTTSITVPAGTFLCHHVQITIPGSFGDTHINQYFAVGKGLIKEDRIITGNGSQGPVSGYAVTELQSTNL